MQNLLSSSLLSKNVKITAHIIIILLVVSFGCDIWSLILKQEHRLRVYRNRVLRNIFGCKASDITVVWRILHNAELYRIS